MSKVAQPVSATYAELQLAELLEQVGSEQPVPGGGSVAAIAVALAAALAEKTARLSTDWVEAGGAVAQARVLRDRALPLAQEDARAFGGVLEAMRTKGGDEALGDALSRAADVPLRIAETAVDVAQLAGDAAEHGNPNLRGDAAAGAVLAAAAARAAANLVEINLATMPDDERLNVAHGLVETGERAARRAAGPA